MQRLFVALINKNISGTVYIYPPTDTSNGLGQLVYTVSVSVRISEYQD